ncbi:TPA: hypothetical protein ACGQML_004371 [Escherichia coli]
MKIPNHLVGVIYHLLEIVFQVTPPATILQQLNPLEHISNAISRICYYKEQCKTIELESLRIKEQASLMHFKIDTEFKKAMYELETRRKNNELKLIAAANDFKQISLTKF